MKRVSAPALSSVPTSFSVLALLSALVPGFVGVAAAQASSTIAVPREKISLVCADSYFKTERTDFILQDELYPHCTLVVPLALNERWPGKRTYYVIPRVSANLYARADRGTGRWLPLSPLVTAGGDPLHTTLESGTYKAVELTGSFGRLNEVAGKNTPDTVGAGGKITVCVSPVLKAEDPCVTFDVTARFKVYRR